MEMREGPTTPPGAGREEIFMRRHLLRHLGWLRGCALRMTGGDQEEAEDLLHDVFFQFARRHLDLERLPDDLPGHLHTMLSDMHGSEIRRALRLRATSPAANRIEKGEHGESTRSMDDMKELERDPNRKLLAVLSVVSLAVFLILCVAQWLGLVNLRGR